MAETQVGKPAAWMKPVASVLVAIGLLVLAWILVSRACDSLFSLDPETRARLDADRERAERYGDAFGAWRAARRFVRARLRSPSTADFGGQMADNRVKEQSPGRWAVAGWVDSQNAFGAVVRSYFVGVLTYDDGHWRVERLDMAER